MVIGAQQSPSLEFQVPMGQPHTTIQPHLPEPLIHHQLKISTTLSLELLTMPPILTNSYSSPITQPSISNDLAPNTFLPFLPKTCPWHITSRLLCTQASRHFPSLLSQLLPAALDTEHMIPPNPLLLGLYDAPLSWFFYLPGCSCPVSSGSLSQGSSMELLLVLLVYTVFLLNLIPSNEDSPSKKKILSSPDIDPYTQLSSGYHHLSQIGLLLFFTPDLFFPLCSPTQLVVQPSTQAPKLEPRGILDSSSLSKFNQSLSPATFS